jgi:hypothetical protein
MLARFAGAEAPLLHRGALLMRRLRSPIGVIPRGFADHRRVDAKHYRAYCLAIQAAWGPLPEIALPALREAGRVAVELERLSHDLEAARARTRRRDASRVRRQQFALREQLGRLERRIEELAMRQNGHRDPLADVKRAVQAAKLR